MAESSPPTDWPTPRGSEPMGEWNAYIFATALEEAAQAWVAANGSDLLDNYSTGGGEARWSRCLAAATDHALSAAHKKQFSPPPPPPPEVPAHGFYLYRLWDAEGRLIYVGVSRCLRRRLAKHRRTWDETVWVKATWEKHEDAPSMLSAELAAIREEDPVLNSVGVQ